MPAPVEGDRIRLVTREAVPADLKSGLYYNYFGGLTGVIRKVYSPDSVVVEIEQESLTTDIRRRHHDIRDQMKTKWLDGLSEEGRSRLTERERDFHLRYVILTAMKDLEPLEGPTTAKPLGPASTAAAEAAEATRRLSSQELAEAEEAELAKHKA